MFLRPIARILIAGGLLYLLLIRVDWAEIRAIMAGLNPNFLAVAILLAIGAVVLSAYKWRLLLVARGWNLSTLILTKLYFVGLFMNNFLPSSIGGDVMRSYQVGRRINNHREAAASVILERLLATVGLAVPALLAVFPYWSLVDRFAGQILLFLLFCLLLVWVIAKPSHFGFLGQIPWLWWQRLRQKVREVKDIIGSYRGRPGVIIQVVFWSVCFQLLIVLINFCLVRAMGIHHIELGHCLLMVPLISAISMVPVSINGLGIREGAYVLLFGSLGLSTGQALTLSMLFFLIVTAISLLGGVIFLVEGEKKAYVITE